MSNKAFVQLFLKSMHECKDMSNKCAMGLTKRFLFCFFERIPQAHNLLLVMNKAKPLKVQNVVMYRSVLNSSFSDQSQGCASWFLSRVVDIQVNESSKKKYSLLSFNSYQFTELMCVANIFTLHQHSSLRVFIMRYKTCW